MKTYNVYEQRPPIRSEYKDQNGNYVFRANLVRMGEITVNGQCPIAQARERFKVRHPVLHELDAKGDEVWRGS